MAMSNGLNEQTTHLPLRHECKILAKDLIDYKLGQSTEPANAAAKTLRKLSDDIEKRNPDLLEQLCTKLNFSKETRYCSFAEIAKEVFSDGVINWGRIAVLYAFGARLGKHCCDNDMSEQLDYIPEWIARFVTGLSDWIEKQGGGVRKFFLSTFCFVYIFRSVWRRPWNSRENCFYLNFNIATIVVL